MKRKTMQTRMNILVYPYEYTPLTHWRLLYGHDSYNRGQNLLRKFTDMYNFGSIIMNLCLLFTITPLPPGQCWI